MLWKLLVCALLDWTRLPFHRDAAGLGDDVGHGPTGACNLGAARNKALFLFYVFRDFGNKVLAESASV